MLKKSVNLKKSFKSKAKSKFEKFVGLMILLFVFAVLSFLWLDRKIEPILWSVVEYESVEQANIAFHKAASNHVFSEKERYKELYTVEKNKNETVALVVADAYAINLIQRELAQCVIDELNAKKQEYYAITLGHLLGIRLLDDFGPKIKFDIQPNSYVQTKIYETFVEAGSNQTKMSVYASFSMNVNVMIAGVSKTITVENDILLWQNIIVGAVPDVNV